MAVASLTKEVWSEYYETQDPEVLESIVTRYAPLVKYVVGRLAISLPSILDSGDIISYGTIGLLNAIRRYDPSRDIKFETYAVPLIRGAIIDALRTLDFLPRSVRQKSKAIKQASDDLQRELGRAASDHEIAEHLGMSMRSYNKVITDCTCVTVSLDSAYDSNDGDEPVTLLSTLEDENSPKPSDLFDRAELRQSLVDCINKLPERERLVISLYYFDELTLREIARVLEVSESRVCQLHARSIMRMKSALKDQAPTA